MYVYTIPLKAISRSGINIMELSKGLRCFSILDNIAVLFALYCRYHIPYSGDQKFSHKCLISGFYFRSI